MSIHKTMAHFVSQMPLYVSIVLYINNTPCTWLKLDDCFMTIKILRDFCKNYWFLWLKLFTRNHICIIKKVYSMYLDIIKIVTNLHGYIVQYTKYHKLQDKTKTIKKNLRSLKENNAKSYLRTEPKHKFKRHCPRKRIDNR